METDLGNILFAPIAHIRYDTRQVLPILPDKLGGRHVLQDRVDSTAVAASNAASNASLAPRMYVNLHGLTYSFLRVS